MNWIGGVVFGVFVLGLLFGSLFSRQRQNPETRDAHADKLDYPTSDDDQTSIGAAARAIVALAKDHQARHEDNRADGERDYRINRGVFIGVCAYTVFTAAILVFTVVQYGEIHRFNKAQRRLLAGQLQTIAGQLKVEQETLNRAYRPRLVVEPISANDLEVTDKTISVGATFIYRNTGVLPAEDVDISEDVVPLKDAVKEQSHVCAEAEIWQRLHLENLRKQGLPELYDVILQNETYPTQRGLSNNKPIDEFRQAEGARNDWIVPALVACVVYRGADDKVVHHTRFLYYFEERTPDGTTTFIKSIPHKAPAANVVIRRWIDGGNSED